MARVLPPRKRCGVTRGVSSRGQRRRGWHVDSHGGFAVGTWRDAASCGRHSLRSGGIPTASTGTVCFVESDRTKHDGRLLLLTDGRKLHGLHHLLDLGSHDGGAGTRLRLDAALDPFDAVKCKPAEEEHGNKQRQADRQRAKHKAHPMRALLSVLVCPLSAECGDARGECRSERRRGRARCWRSRHGRGGRRR